MKVSTLASSLLLLCSSSVMAHFILDYPPSRGFDDDAEPNAPCGGFNAVPTNRSSFPISGGFVDINSFHVSSTLSVYVAIGNNPTAADFTTAAQYSAVSPSPLSISHPGHSCVNVNLTSIPGVANNTNATIQLIYNGGDGELYQCADVVLVTSAPGFDKSQCITDNGESTTNSTGGSQTKSGAVGSRFGAASGVMAGVLGAVVAAIAMA